MVSLEMKRRMGRMRVIPWLPKLNNSRNDQKRFRYVDSFYIFAKVK